MLKILSILCFFIFVVPFLLRVVLRFLFGTPTQTSKTSQQRKNTSSSSASSRSHTQQSVKKKVIPEDEGEYVDYEEVKE